jgi:hypothetical protein
MTRKEQRRKQRRRARWKDALRKRPLKEIMRHGTPTMRGSAPIIIFGSSGERAD